MTTENQGLASALRDSKLAMLDAQRSRMVRQEAQAARVAVALDVQRQVEAAQSRITALEAEAIELTKRGDEEPRRGFFKRLRGRQAQPSAKAIDGIWAAIEIARSQYQRLIDEWQLHLIASGEAVAWSIEGDPIQVAGLPTPGKAEESKNGGTPTSEGAW